MHNTITRKPAWLNKKVDLGKCRELHSLLSANDLNTVCREAACPNISECAANKVATVLILGAVCTRKCRFCSVRKGIPERLDFDEPRRVAESIKRIGLKHAVITRVTRDDIPDGGAAVFARTIREIRAIDPGITVEVLVPDFIGKRESVETVLSGKPVIFAHNLETVPRLYPAAREGADYKRSLDILKYSKEIDKTVFTKSGLMLGLGEKEDEVMSVLEDLASIGCDFLSIGQYLAPSRAHIPVYEYIHPDRFVHFKETGIKMGFRHIESGPYVRSSYLASGYPLNVPLKKEGACTT